jgi:DNA-binding transcriptional LysR family regulator
VKTVNLNKLRTFIEVVESGSISRAAQNLFRTQPAISSALKDLEEEVGLQLFERRNGKIFITPEGKDLYNFSHQRILELDDKVHRMRDALSELTGTIRIGILHDFSKHLSARIAQGFHSNFPHVRFRFHSLTSHEMESRMLDGELDFAFMVSYQYREQFEIEHFMNFFREPMAAPSYLKRVGDIKDYEDLCRNDHLALGERIGSLRMWLKKNCDKPLDHAVDKIEPLVLAENMSIFNDMVLRGMGIGLCYKELLQTELNRRQLVRLFPKAKPIYITLDICRRKVKSNNLLMDTFWEYLKSQITYDKNDTV